VRAPVAVIAALVALSACSSDDGGGDDGGDGGDDGGDDGGGDDDGSGEPADLVGTTAAHNEVRAAHGVDPLSWDPALAAIALAWAERCVDQEDPAGLIDHNPGRSDGYGAYVGENVYGSGGAASGAGAVRTWASEESVYDYEANSCAGVCGHYTQIVWADTTKVGCGLHLCDGLTYGNTIVCDYAPGGNDGGRPY
jgi:pathogenesis-related protein 1